jgi:hypothetical protein
MQFHSTAGSSLNFQDLVWLIKICHSCTWRREVTTWLYNFQLIHFCNRNFRTGIYSATNNTKDPERCDFNIHFANGAKNVKFNLNVYEQLQLTLNF